MDLTHSTAQHRADTTGHLPKAREEVNLRIKRGSLLAKLIKKTFVWNGDYYDDGGDSF